MDVPWWTITTAHLCTFWRNTRTLTRFFLFLPFELSKKKHLPCIENPQWPHGPQGDHWAYGPMSQMEVCNAWVSPLFSIPINFHLHIGDVQINYINTLKGKQMFVIPLEVDGDNMRFVLERCREGPKNKIGPKKCAITQYALSLPLQSWKTRSMTYDMVRK